MKHLLFFVLSVWVSSILLNGQEIIRNDRIKADVSLPYPGDGLYQGDSAFVSVSFICSCIGAGPHTYTLGADMGAAVVIEGEDYVDLTRGESGILGKSVPLLVNCGSWSYPINCANFDIKSTALRSDNDINVKIRVIVNGFDNPCIYTINLVFQARKRLKFFLNPAEPIAGDTAEIIIKRQLLNDSLIDFPSSATFEVAQIEGCEHGTILWQDSTDSYFVDVPQPFKFIVDSLMNDSLVVDSASIRLQVGLYNENAKKHSQKILPSEILSSRVTLTDSLIAIRLKEFTCDYSRRKKIEIAKNGNACFTGEFLSKISQTLGFQVTHPVLELIYPKADSPPDTISAEPAMPNILCKARLKNYKGGYQLFWEYSVGLYIRRLEAIIFKGGEVCPRESYSTFIGDNFGNSEDTVLWSIPFTKSAMKTYRLKAKYPFLPNRISMYDGRLGCTKLDTIYDSMSNEIFVGGDISISLVAVDGSKRLLATNSFSGNSIIGINPSPEKVKEFSEQIDNQSCMLFVLIKYESGGNFNQFERNNSKRIYSAKIDDHLYKDTVYFRKGFPYYGPPNGFGLGQIDNATYEENGKKIRVPNERCLWYWKLNVYLAKIILEEKKEIVRTFMNNQNLPYTNEQYLQNVFGKYNGNYVWGRSKFGWVLTGKTYGINRYNEYLNCLENK